jgi:hypothetical protein
MSATPLPGPSPAPGYATDSEELFDYALVGAWLRFALGSVRRHRRKAAVVFLGFFCLSLTTPFVLPKKWKTETEILVQRNQMDAVANPGPTSEDAPTRAASELIMRRDNLIALIKQTNLLEQYERGRPAPLLALDKLRRLASGPMTEEDKYEALISILEKRLTVTTDESKGKVTISLTWADPLLSYRLVDALQQNFIESRHTIEVSSIAELITILEGHSAELRDNITSTIEELRKATEPPASLTPTGARPVPTPRPGPDPEAVELESRIAAAAKAINDLEENRNRRLTELQGQLAEQVGVLGPSHPEIVNRRLSIEALQRDSPQIEALRREQKALRERLAAVVARRQAPEKAPPPAPAPINIGEGRSGAGPREDDVGLAYLRNQQRIMSEKLEEMQGRIKDARIKLDIARAGFKNRYVIVQPARIPKKPASPPAVLFVAAGAVAGLLFGLVAAVLADVRAGQILEAWQIEKVLKLPLLGEVRLP